MDSKFFAQMMANLCKPPFSEWILQVPDRHTDKDQARRVIGTLSFANQMSGICSLNESKELIRHVAVRFFTEATSAALNVQAEAVRRIIGTIAHANHMAGIVRHAEAVQRIFATVRPLVDATLSWFTVNWNFGLFALAS